YNTVYAAGSDGILLSGANLTATVEGNIFSGCGSTGMFTSGGLEMSSQYCSFFANQNGPHGGGATTGTGDIFENPMLVQPATGDFSLEPESPCIDAGSPILEDPDGTVRDIGAIFFNQNNPPVIDSFLPENLTLGTFIGETIEFSVVASDAENHMLLYSWYDRETLISRDETAEVTITVGHQPGDSIWVMIDDQHTGSTKLTWRLDAVPVDENVKVQLPKQFAINSIHPNPFNPATTVSLALPRAGVYNLSVYDVLGRMVTNQSERTSAGFTTLQLNAESWSSGLYFVRAEFEGVVATEKIVRLQ
ncbi:T9SS type A sorting domain-containing protein, partial [bacterium]|nr:T9SS type A sorting domain-containing protein [bacterium]